MSKDVLNLTSLPKLSNQRFYSTSYPPHSFLSMPALSPTMSAGNIVEWKVSQGTEIAPGDVLAEIETDKATLSWENQDDGYIAKILVPAGSKDVAIGAPVAVIVEDAGTIAAFKDYTASGDNSSSSITSKEEAKSPGGSKNIKESAHKDGAPSKVVKVSSRVGPAVRKLMQEAGLSPSSMNPTGPRGIITKGDVLEALSNGKISSRMTSSESDAPSPVKAAPSSQAASARAQEQAYTDIPNSQVRKIIAQRLLLSKETIPHLYLSAEVNLDPVNTLREQLKKGGNKVSVNDFVVRAAAVALAMVPDANASWDENEEAAKRFESVDISIAVATEGGLITPIVRKADKKSLKDVSAEVRDLAGRARANKLKPEEFQGGSFSISNLGMFGVDEFFAIINPPQAAIMAVGGARREAVLGEGNQVEAVSKMTVTLSADNRVYDGKVASDFLKEFQYAISTPEGLL